MDKRRASEAIPHNRKLEINFSKAKRSGTLGF